MKYINIKNNLNIIKKLVFILILFVFSLMFITNVKADALKLLNYYTEIIDTLNE